MSCVRLVSRQRQFTAYGCEHAPGQAAGVPLISFGRLLRTVGAAGIGLRSRHSCAPPGVKDRNTGGRKVGYVAGDDCHSMNECGCGN